MLDTLLTYQGEICWLGLITTCFLLFFFFHSLAWTAQGSFNNYVDKRRWVGGSRNGTQVFPYNIKEIHSQMSTRGRSDMIGGQEVAKFRQRSLWTPPCSISPRVALGHQSSPPFMTSIIDQVSPHKVLFIKWLLSTMFKNWNTSGNPVTFWLVSSLTKQRFLQ